MLAFASLFLLGYCLPCSANASTKVDNTSIQEVADGEITAAELPEKGKERLVGALLAEDVKGEHWSINETIDDSVIQRWKNNLTYRPNNPVNFYRMNSEATPS